MKLDRTRPQQIGCHHQTKQGQDRARSLQNYLYVHGDMYTVDSSLIGYPYPQLITRSPWKLYTISII